MINWLIAPAKGLLQAAEDGYLPPLFLRKNPSGVPSNILIGQALLVSLISLLFLLPGSAAGCFWLLTALSTELYMLMYILMFAAALKLHTPSEKSPLFHLSTKTLWSLSTLGFIGCAITIGVSLLPPSEEIVSNPFAYVVEILACNALALFPLWLFSAYKTRNTTSNNTHPFHL
jgi:amino acid transporter